MFYFLINDNTLIKSDSETVNGLQLGRDRFLALQDYIKKNYDVLLTNAGSDIEIRPTVWLYEGAIYRSDINGENIPSAAVKLTDEQTTEIVNTPTRGFYFEGDSLKSRELVAETTAKQQMQFALAGLTYDFGDGRVIQTRPLPFADESNIRNAIELLTTHPELSPIKWRMADNSAQLVTKEDLQAALNHGILSAAQIWADYLG